MKEKSELKKELADKKEREGELYKAIGANIEKYRKPLKLTQEELAEKLGISRVALTCIENGKQRLPVHLLRDICLLLHVGIGDIVPIGYKSARPTPAVEAKTAEEILNKICGDWMPCKIDGKIVPAYLHDDVIKCMEAYHAQLKPQLTEKVDYSKEVQASMSDEEIRIINMLAEKEPSCYADMASIMIEYAAWQQVKQAAAMRRLRESLEKFLSLEDLIRYCGEIKEEHLGEAQAINNAFRVAKEALK